MNKFKGAAMMAAVAVFLLTSLASAVTPPAPQEWFDRINMPMPEGLRSGLPPQVKAISGDLEQFSKGRSKAGDNLLLILVEFSDNPANSVTHPSSAYDDLMFSHGVVPTGSLREYYEEVSYGTFSPTGAVTVWITAPQPYTYYSAGDYGTGSYPNNSQGLLEDCVSILDPTLDFSAFDNDGDGYAEAIFLVHSGPGAEETGDPDDIWSHAWYHEYETMDGVFTGRYSVEPEEHFDGSLIHIGVFCHEYGHVLGMPDLYDTDGSSEGIGVYCLMAGGSWGALPGNPERPTHMSAEIKRRLDWLVPVTVTGATEDLVLTPAASTPVCYRVDNDTNPNEYFLIEFRGKVGFDSLFRGDGGLAIWHVDWDGWQQDETFRYVSLEQADGSGDLERDYGTGNRHERTNRGDAGDLFPGAAGNTHFSWSSYPNSLQNNGLADIMTIANIEQFDSDSIRIDLYGDPAESIFRVTDVLVLDTVTSAGDTDNDGQADSGETVHLQVNLAVDGVTPTLFDSYISTVDTRVLINQAGGGNYGLPAHGTVAGNGVPFEIEVLSASIDSSVQFTLHLDVDGASLALPFQLNINRPQILFVVDNNGSNWSDDAVEAARNSGYTFDLWNTDLDGMPASYDLAHYQAVLWTNGSYFGARTSNPDYEYCLTAEEKALLSGYIDDYGRLALFSQDYLYDWGLDAFATDYLHVETYNEDLTSTDVEGFPLGFLSGFSGTAPTWTFYDYTDRITAGSNTDVVARDYNDGNAVAIAYPSIGPGFYSHSTFFSCYALERLDPTSLSDIFPPLFEWLLSSTNIEVPTPIFPKHDTTVADFSVTLSWTASAGATAYFYQLATDSAFANVVSQQYSSANSFLVPDTLTSGEYYWHVSAVPFDGPPTRDSRPAHFYFQYDPSFVCGDANGDGSDPDIADLVYLVSYMFQNGPPPPIMAATDVNNDGTAADIADLVHLVSYMFQNGDPLECP